MANTRTFYCAHCGAPVEVPKRLTEVRRVYCPLHPGGKVQDPPKPVKAKAEPAPEPMVAEATEEAPKPKKRARPRKKPSSSDS